MIELRELFESVYGVNLEYNTMNEIKGGIPFVARTSQNNGVVGYVERIEDVLPNPAMTISLSASGSVMESFLQEKEYYSGRDLYYLKPKTSLSKNQMLYYCMVLRANKYRYTFGRQANKTLDYIKVPSPDDIPSYVHTTQIKKPSKRAYSHHKINLKDREWRLFQCGGENGIFDITLGKPIHKNEVEDGNLPYITRTALNNGVETFGNNYNINKGSAITIGAEGIKAFYQEYNFITGNKINIMRHKHLNKYTAMFLCAVLNYTNINSGRYNYGYAIVNHRLRILQIKLPVTNEGSKPDWQFMEDYIKSLPYSSNLQAS